MITRFVNGMEKIIFHSWWVIFFILICYMSYEQELRKRNRDYAHLHQQLLELERKKERALASREDLLLQINSQNDPAWIELTLMKELGVVPVGQIKVFFQSDNE